MCARSRIGLLLSSISYYNRLKKICQSFIMYIIITGGVKL